MSWLTICELSTPHFWQTKVMGAFAISGLMSKEYFAPHEHWIFIGHLWLSKKGGVGNKL
jgi:hypothetical protein